PPVSSTLSLPDALPIYARGAAARAQHPAPLRLHRSHEAGAGRWPHEALVRLLRVEARRVPADAGRARVRLRAGRRQLVAAGDRRSEEHTSELQSRENLV